MQVSFTQGDIADLPISCTVCLVQESVIGTGWVWSFDASRCQVQSPLLASPGMLVMLYLHLPSRAGIRVEGLVTWARESEFGLQFTYPPALRPRDIPPGNR